MQLMLQYNIRNKQKGSRNLQSYNLNLNSTVLFCRGRGVNLPWMPSNRNSSTIPKHSTELIRIHDELSHYVIKLRESVHQFLRSQYK